MMGRPLTGRKGLLCPLSRLHQKCGVGGDLFHLAGRCAAGEYPGHHVLYIERVYTEWYRNKSYDFTITSSTAYDQTWSFGRTIYRNISQIVDEMFNNYLSRPNVRQPILTQYCDGKNVSCPNWLSQWGSEIFGRSGIYGHSDSALLLRQQSVHQFGGGNLRRSCFLPGTNLSIGSTGSKVRQMQEQLAVISRSYPAIPRIAADGIYGPKTKEAVEAFQRIFSLPVTGVVDFATWYKDFTDLCGCDADRGISVEQGGKRVSLGELALILILTQEGCIAGNRYLGRTAAASPSACQCAGCLQAFPACGCHIFLGLSLAHFSFLCMIKV